MAVTEKRFETKFSVVDHGSECDILNKNGTSVLVIKQDMPDGFYNLIVPSDSSEKFYCVDHAPIAFKKTEAGISCQINKSFAELSEEQKNIGLWALISECVKAKKISFNMHNLDTEVYWEIIAKISYLQNLKRLKI